MGSSSSSQESRRESTEGTEDTSAMLMTPIENLECRAALGAAAALATVAAGLWQAAVSIPRKSFDQLLYGTFSITRLGLFWLIFVALRIPPHGDLPAFYYPQALAVLQGHLPYRDFPSSYAPLHPWLDALLLRVQNTPLAIMLGSVLVEILALPVWMRLARTFLPESEVRIAGMLYLASPISLQFVTVDGQDNVAIALLIGLSILLALRRREVFAGAAAAFAAASVKFLPLLYFPAFLAAVPRRWRWAGGAGLVLVAVYGAFVLLGTPILQPLTAEAATRTAGNLPYLIEAVGGFLIPGRLCDTVVILTTVCIAVIVRSVAKTASSGTRTSALTFGVSAITLAMLLFAKKSWPPYLMLCLFPLCLLAARQSPRRKARIVSFAAFSLVAVTVHSVWATVSGQQSSQAMHGALRHGERAPLLFLCLHLLLLAGYGWLLLEAISRIRSPCGLSGGSGGS